MQLATVSFSKSNPKRKKNSTMEIYTYFCTSFFFCLAIMLTLINIMFKHEFLFLIAKPSYRTLKNEILNRTFFNNFDFNKVFF